MPTITTSGLATARGFGMFLPQKNSIPLPDIGSAIEGGFYVGSIRIGATNYALIMAPKATGQTTGFYATNNSFLRANSASDGLANTVGASSASYPVNAWSRNLTIGGFTDWYIPARDELELAYRNLKPSAVVNSIGARVQGATGDTNTANGSNLNSVPVGAAYTTSSPAQTPLTLFQTGGAECLDASIYWCSTGNAALTFQLLQRMSDGIQSYDLPSSTYTARAFRRVIL